MIETKSPVADNFSLLTHDIKLNEFTQLGKGQRGSYHVAIFFKETLDWSKLVLEETTFKHSSECIQQLVSGVEGTIIGSIFKVSLKKLEFNKECLKILTRSHMVGEFKTNTDCDISGALVFEDSTSNLIVIPSNFNPNKFAVLP